MQVLATTNVDVNCFLVFLCKTSRMCQLGNAYIADVDKCPQDKCCLDKCLGDSCYLLYMFPGPFV